MRRATHSASLQGLAPLSGTVSFTMLKYLAFPSLSEPVSITPSLHLVHKTPPAHPSAFGSREAPLLGLSEPLKALKALLQTAPALLHLVCTISLSAILTSLRTEAASDHLSTP